MRAPISIMILSLALAFVGCDIGPDFGDQNPRHLEIEFGGTVKSAATGNPIAAAMVYLTASGGLVFYAARVDSSKTDTNGYYSIDLTGSCGSLWFEVVADGYHSTPAELSTAPKCEPGVQLIDIALDPIQ